MIIHVDHAVCAGCGADISPAITLDGVTVRYGRQIALHEISGSFVAGSLTAMAGPNGAGKSTLLKVMAGIIRPSSGRVVVDERFRGKIAYLPQTSAMNRDFPLSAMQTACMGFWTTVGDTGEITAAMTEKAAAALAKMGLSGLEDRPIGALSGGQFQRLLLSRVMLQAPEVILLDEPFASLDAESTARLMRLLLDWHAEGKTIVCALHDLLLIRKYFPESFLLAGKCLGRGHTHELFEQKLLSFDLDMAELRSPTEHDHR